MEKEESPILLTAVVSALTDGGWNDLSLFKAPPFALEDWFRERGRDDYAALFAAPSFVISFRDHLWVHGDSKHFLEMSRHVSQVAKQLAKKGGDE